MPMLTNSELSESSLGRPTAPVASARPAATAAARTSAAGLLLGLLGLASFGFALIRLRGDWHVSPHATSHHLSILGQELSYPVANAAAVVVLVLALLGAIVTGIAVFGAGRELAASRRFGRHLLAV